MQHTQADTAAPGTGVRARPRAVLPALCATQITSWGIVYYAFPVLLPRLTADTGWSTNAATAAFSLALLVSGVAGIPIGRILDRRGPRAVMTVGSAVGVLALLVVAAAPNLIVFTLGWLLAGIAMAATFYPPAFAALTRWWGPDRIRALTIVTLAGGLASTVFAPLTALLAEHLSWRATYAVLAVVLAVVTIPAHALALRAPWPPAAHPRPRDGRTHPRVRPSAHLHPHRGKQTERTPQRSTRALTTHSASAPTPPALRTPRSQPCPRPRPAPAAIHATTPSLIR